MNSLCIYCDIKENYKISEVPKNRLHSVAVDYFKAILLTINTVSDIPILEY